MGLTASGCMVAQDAALMGSSPPRWPEAEPSDDV
jgi:hypothetical protein